MFRFQSGCRILLFGAGGTKGGVQRVQLTKEYNGYQNWFLSHETRNELAKLHHVLVPEYFLRLYEKHSQLEKWQETNLSDPSEKDCFTNHDKTPFDYIAWNKKYRDEIDTATRFYGYATQLEDTMNLLSRLSREDACMPSSQKHSPSLSLSEEEKELLPLIKQDKENLILQIRAMDKEIESIMSRRLEREDIVGSSSRLWLLSVAGKAGGEEASLFAEELADVLQTYCTSIHGWNVRKASESECGASGGDEVAYPEEGCISVIEGDSVYRHLHHEIGVHKVQRVPITDGSGKMQTSTAVVKLLPILDPVSVQVYENDCKIDFVRGSGPGGQGMQSSSNCVVLTHLPSGITVKCHQSRSALGNKALALQHVARQLLARRVKDRNSSLYGAWSNQWSSGERSDKMRTYNYPQNRVTDHRLGKDYPLTQFLEGGNLVKSLHDDLNAISDREEISSTLLRHITGNFGSEG